jgi:hypothetical protein
MVHNREIQGNHKFCTSQRTTRMAALGTMHHPYYIPANLCANFPELFWRVHKFWLVANLINKLLSQVNTFQHKGWSLTISLQPPIYHSINFTKNFSSCRQEENL